MNHKNLKIVLKKGRTFSDFSQLKECLQFDLQLWLSILIQNVCPNTVYIFYLLVLESFSLHSISFIVSRERLLPHEMPWIWHHPKRQPMVSGVSQIFGFVLIVVQLELESLASLCSLTWSWRVASFGQQRLVILLWKTRPYLAPKCELS